MKKLMIICSSSFYGKIPDIERKLEGRFELIFPNCYNDVVTSDNYSDMSDEEYCQFFKKMYHESHDKIEKVDICLVLNFDKEKEGILYKNYIGASTFLEMYEAFMLDKKIYLYNELPDKNNMLFDEIKGFSPIIINQNLDLIK